MIFKSVRVSETSGAEHEIPKHDHRMDYNELLIITWFAVHCFSSVHYTQRVVQI